MDETVKQAADMIAECIKQGIPSIIIFSKLINKSTQEFSRSDMTLYVEWLAMYNTIKSKVVKES